jgi:tetratricopeptide (TPR) repeat protein
LHEQFAGWLDAHAHLVEQDEIVGYHLEQAARYLEEIGSPKPDVAEHAFRRLAAAGRGALNRSDWNAARSLMRRALALIPVGQSARVDVLPDYYIALAESGEWDEVRATVTELQESPDGRAQAYGAIFAVELEMTHVRSRFPSTALDAIVAAATEQFERVGDAKGLAYASRLAAYERWASLRIAEAIESFEAAAANAARAGAHYLEDDAGVRIARSQVMGPIPIRDAIERLEQLVQEYAERPLLLGVIRATLARAFATRGDIDAARELQHAEDVLLEAGMKVEATSAYHTRAWVARCAGDFDEEERMLRREVETLEGLGDRAYLSTASMLLGTCLAQRGKDGEAQKALERGRETTHPGDFIDLVGLDALEAVLRARRGELDEAQELAGRALARAEETDSVVLRLDTRWSAAEVFELAARGDEAKALLEESVEIAERYGHLVAAERTRERLAAGA